VLEHVFHNITSSIRKYQGPKAICKLPERQRVPGAGAGYACDAMVLGTLLKELDRVGLWPIPSPPYSSHTVQEVMQSISRMRIRSLCEINEEGAFGKPPRQADEILSHGQVKHNLSLLTDYVERVMKGLSLKDFK
jgi:hypothetical protein